MMGQRHGKGPTDGAVDVCGPCFGRTAYVLSVTNIMSDSHTDAPWSVLCRLFSLNCFAFGSRIAQKRRNEVHCRLSLARFDIS
jgi:hypothetical protein